MGHGLSAQAAGKEERHQASGPGRCSRRHREPPQQSGCGKSLCTVHPQCKGPEAGRGRRGMGRPEALATSA